MMMSPLGLLLLLPLLLQPLGLQQLALPHMFEFLLDEPAADPAPAAAAAAAPAAAARRRQRGGVAAHSNHTKTKLKLAKARRNSARHESTVLRLANINVSSFSNHVASVSFGRKTPESRNVLMFANGDHVADLTSKHGNRCNDYRVARLYGSVSAAYAQAAAIDSFLHPDLNGKLLSSISIGSFDDASMWMKDPCTAAEREDGTRCEGLKLKDGTLWKRGRNICLPVYNSTEAIITRRQLQLDNTSEQILRSAIIQSPSQVLPAANTGTIANRRRRWLAAGISGAGSYIDSQSAVSSVDYASSWHTIVSTKDNLALNDCVIGLDEAALKVRMDSGFADNFSTPTILSLNCAGHSAVLSTKEVSARSDGLTSKLVRMGHQFENGRVTAKFNELIEQKITALFEFVPVAAMPIESQQWNYHALNVLRISSPCLDLSKSDVEFIVSIDNGDWTQPSWKHFCIGDQCLCRGSRGSALRLMVKAGKLSVGKMESTPLEYRWKGMERFAAKTFRGRQQHDIYFIVCLEIWPPAQTQRSEAAMAMAMLANEDHNSNDSLRHKANIRGGKTVDWMQQDLNGDSLKHFLLLNVGVQGYLNKCFKADELVTKYTGLLQQVPNSLNNLSSIAKALAGHVAEAGEKCISANLHILSGAAADEALSQYSAFFDFCDSSWDGWNISCQQQRFTTCCDLIVVMQDLFYRLQFKMDIPKLRVLSVCSLDLDDEDCDILQAVGSIVRPLRDKAVRCDQCVDFAFSLPWIHRLMDHGPATAKQAWLALRDVASLLRVASTLVEKKHLVGQEAKPRKRGVCIAADEVGGFVFRKLIEKAAGAARDAATADCLGKHLRQFNRCLTELMAQGHADRRSEVAAASNDGNDDDGRTQKNALGKRCTNILNLDGKLKRQRVRGYDVFVRSNFSGELEGPCNFTKRKQLDAKWNLLSDVEKASYSSIAEVEDSEEEAHVNDNFVEFLARSSMMEGGKKKKSKRWRNARLRAVNRTIQDMLGHSVFDSGTALHDYGTGLKPGLIQSQLNQSEVRKAYKDLFDYDHEPVPNPPGYNKYFKPCCTQHGGYCKHDELVNRADVLSRNLYKVCQPWKSDFPVLLQIGGIGGDTSEFVFLGKLFGSSTGIFSQCVFVPRDNPDLYDCCDLQFQSGVHQPVTSHSVFMKVLRDAAEASEVDPTQIEQLVLRRWNFAREPITKFRARLIDIHSELHCTCARLDKVKTAAAAAEEDDALPFGLGQRRQAASAADAAPPAPGPFPVMSSDTDFEAAHYYAPSCNESVANDNDDDDADNDNGDVDDAGHDPPGSDDCLDDESWNSKGIKSMEVTPAKARALCGECKRKIDPGTVRFDYRYRVSDTLGDQKRIHASCVRSLPADTRVRDRAQLKRWLRAGDLPHDVAAAVESALAKLN